MANRVGYTILFTVLGVSTLLAACGDDPAVSDEESGGAGGEPSSTAGSKSAGSSSGGNSGGKAGAPNGGKAGSGQAGEGGEPVVGGAAGSGGASEAGAGGNDGSGGDDGAAGAGGAGLEYACNSTTISHKVCSALVAANCPDPTICADCVGERNTDLEVFGECPACGVEYDAFLQCGIDAYENGDLPSGVECVEGYGADMTLTCLAHLDSAVACDSYRLDNPCPETWPLE